MDGQIGKITFKHLYETYKNIVGFLVFIAVVLQTGIIIQYHMLGSYDHYTAGELLTVIVSRSATGFVSSLIVALPFIYLIKFLNLFFPWGKRTIARISAEIIVVVTISFLTTMVVFLLVEGIITDTSEENLSLLKGTLTYSVTNLIFIAALEGYMFYRDHKRAKREEAVLRDEIASIKLNILKSQINQHFMFNSLNVLSGLLKRDPEKALLFIEEFSNIYRYVLESIEQSLTSLDKEVSFIRSYLYLQQIRYGNSLKYSENISEKHLRLSLPPLSLQVIFENAIKHNIVNEDHPLLIEVVSHNDELIIKNNFQPKISKFASTGLGQKNIQRRYQIICEKSPEFILENGYYTARLPLIQL
ncbi:MAG: histidine kinase [Bacteroidales bacterium]|nr:histidine kinase [Bacteroidales bacterium]